MASTTTLIKSEAQRTLHAGVGAADLALEAVRTYVADAQKRLTAAQKSVTSIDLEPKALRSQATTAVTSRVDELSKEARARRAAIEKRVAELQGDAQKLVKDGVATATGTYEQLAKRGETVVKRVRKETSSVVDPGPVKKDTGVTTTSPAKKAPARGTTAKRAPAKKSTAKKSTAKKAAAAK